MEPSASGSSSWTPQRPVVDMHKKTQCPSWLSVQLRPAVLWTLVFRPQYQKTAITNSHCSSAGVTHIRCTLKRESNNNAPPPL